MFAIVPLATFALGYSVCWFSASSPTPLAAAADTIIAKDVEKKEKKEVAMVMKKVLESPSAPVKTFRGELEERVRADYIRREFLRSKLEAKFKNAEPKEKNN